ncbi:MAG: 50S ribosomal protein L11 methyltransferase [Muribaculaceae bacterium]
MNDYKEVRLDLEPFPGEDATDLLAGMLGDIGYESFVPDERGVTAYVALDDYDADALADTLADFPYQCKIAVKATTIEGRDWNEEWERHYFQPIVVGNRCVVHSSFHTDIPTAEYDVVIDPKMAFGTGHHATTSLILSRLLNMDLDGRSLIDMGTGTGILAILAAMRGAKPVTAIEIDEFAKVNAVENVAVNGHPEINVILGDASALEHVAPAEVFVANINRNVITGDIARYAERLLPGGTMLLSGFYEDDIPVVRAAAEAVGLQYVTFTECNRWVCLQLRQPCAE